MNVYKKKKLSKFKKRIIYLILFILMIIMFYFSLFSILVAGKKQDLHYYDIVKYDNVVIANHFTYFDIKKSLDEANNTNKKTIDLLTYGKESLKFEYKTKNMKTQKEELVQFIRAKVEEYDKKEIKNNNINNYYYDLIKLKANLIKYKNVQFIELTTKDIDEIVRVLKSFDNINKKIEDIIKAEEKVKKNKEKKNSESKKNITTTSQGSNNVSSGINSNTKPQTKPVSNPSNTNNSTIIKPKPIEDKSCKYNTRQEALKVALGMDKDYKITLCSNNKYKIVV